MTSRTSCASSAPTSECDFTRRGLPIVAVDEPIYRRLPAFLIATVDKFASLPWAGQAGTLLGGLSDTTRRAFMEQRSRARARVSPLRSRRPTS